MLQNERAHHWMNQVNLNYVFTECKINDILKIHTKKQEHIILPLVLTKDNKTNDTSLISKDTCTHTDVLPGDLGGAAHRQQHTTSQGVVLPAPEHPPGAGPSPHSLRGAVLCGEGVSEHSDLPGVSTVLQSQAKTAMPRNVVATHHTQGSMRHGTFHKLTSIIYKT